MFLRLNRDRSALGLPPLQYDVRLADVARAHSADMRDHRFFAHHSPTTGSLDDRLNRAGYLFHTARENLSEARDVQAGQDSLLESPGHHANIVATDTTQVGIGIVSGGVEARENLSITQVFARPGRSESPAVARRGFIQQIQNQRARNGLKPATAHPLLEKLADDQITELDQATSPKSLESVGTRISSAVSGASNTGLRSVAVGAQLLPDSESFQVPEPLLTQTRARFGLAVRKVSNAAGRPMLQLLVLVGE